MRLAAVVTALALAALPACTRLVAPPPPGSAPVVERDTVVAGHPLTVAARAARVLGESQFRTRRFGADSTWAYQSTDRFSVRLRYVPRNDSTRIMLQMWAPCAGTPGCVRGDAAALFAELASAEPPPQ